MDPWPNLHGHGTHRDGRTSDMTDHLRRLASAKGEASFYALLALASAILGTILFLATADHETSAGAGRPQTTVVVWAVGGAS
jgi:hypothetical protein